LHGKAVFRKGVARVSSSLFPLSILIADDNRDQAESLADVVTLWGHDAYVCLDTQVAFGYYYKFWPDVMLLDIGFPLRSDGLGLASQIKKLSKTKETTVIAITGFDDDETRELAMQSGFDHYFIKPMNLETLKNLLEEIQVRQAGS
jgi:DNA-binding response OmpR family regulator